MTPGMTIRRKSVQSTLRCATWLIAETPVVKVSAVCTLAEANFGGTPSAISKVLEIWNGDLDWMHERVDGGILTVAMHPQVIGRAHRIAMLGSFIEHCLEPDGSLKFERMCDVAKRLK